ncbi:glycoside hydrolase family 15 protein, partial [Actinocorallia lasiicapitis]
MARRWVRPVAALLAVAAVAATCASNTELGQARWDSPGLVGGGGWPFVSTPISAADARDASYIPGSSVVRLADGRALLIPHGESELTKLPADDPRVADAVEGDRGWLDDGRVPGQTGVHRAMASRALLDLRLLTSRSGASTASWYGLWNYVWPRDAAFHAAAFAATGHLDEARRILSFLNRVQGPDGRWASRYRVDGTPATDRPVQLDEIGWTLWATWFVAQHDPNPTAYYRMAAKGADWISAHLGPDGLPPVSSDYFERHPSTEQVKDRPTLGVSAPLLVGLRSAAALAGPRHPVDSARWRRAAHTLDTAIRREYGRFGYPRSPIMGGRMDASVTFLAPPFAPQDHDVAAAIANAGDRLKVANGGVLPGEQWAGDKSQAWTPEVAMFALAAVASGRPVEARGRLDWLAGHRTELG